VANVAVGACVLHCPLSPSAMPATRPGTKAGVTFWPFPGFSIFGVQSTSATTGTSAVGLATRAMARRSQSREKTKRLRRSYTCSLCRGLWFTVDLLIYGSTWPSTLLFVTDYDELRHLRLGRVNLPVGGFGIKAGLLRPGSFVLVSQRQSICYQGLARITSMNALASATAYKATQVRML
jgi:hypothetical protein